MVTPLLISLSLAPASWQPAQLPFLRSLAVESIRSVRLIAVDGSPTTDRPLPPPDGTESARGPPAGGVVLVLENPMYARKIAPPPPPPAPPPAPPQSARKPSLGERGVGEDDKLGGPPVVGEATEVIGAKPVRRKKFGKDAPPAGSKGAGSFDDVKRGKKVLRERRGSGRRIEDETAATARAPRPKKARGKRGAAVVAPIEPKGPAKIKLMDSITVGDLAQQLGVGASEVVKDLMKMGTLASITQSIDVETAAKIAKGFGAEVTIGDNLEDEVRQPSILLDDPSPGTPLPIPCEKALPSPSPCAPSSALTGTLPGSGDNHAWGDRGGR